MKMHHGRWLTTAVAGVAAAAIVAGCGGASGSGTNSGAAGGGAGDNRNLSVNVAVAPATLDPAVGCGLTDLLVIGNVYTRLTQYGSKAGPDGTTQIDPSKIEPYAAESWETSDGGKTVTFKLRPGMTFPSGKPVDAAAVKYSFERVMTMASCGIYFVTDGILEPPLIESIETPDDLTVVFRLVQADPNALQAWAQPAASIVDPSVVDANGGVEKAKTNEWMQTHTAGAGPYLLESYEPNKMAVLKANPGYFGDKPATELITIKFINSDPTLLLEAKSGNADVTIGLSKQSVKSLEGNGAVRVIANESPFSEQIGMPNKQAPFDNKQFREALTHALPYDDIVEKAAFGYGTTYYGPIQPAFPEFNADLSAARKYDKVLAKQLIEQSGVKTPVDVEMVVQEGNTADEQIATLAQGEWADLGVNVKVRKLAASEYITGLQEHKYQSYVRLDGPGVIDPGYYLSWDMKCELPINLTEVCIPKADEMLANARTLTEPAERRKLFDEITKMWTAESPKIQVYADKHVTVLSKDVKSYLYSHEADFRTWSK
jgi:peptide/nickel transport system substrate-binding protein